MAIRVLVIDDSALMRALLAKEIIRAPDIEVVGAAADPIEARELIKTLNPDVLTLDVEMPKMNGLEFLSRLMRLRPMPVVMISALTAEGSDAAMRALELGAIEIMGKPKVDSAGTLTAYSEVVCEKIRAAFASRNKVNLKIVAEQASKPLRPQLPAISRLVQERHLIAIGASTGGTEAIRQVLTALPAEMPGIVMTQHMPELFTGTFAKRLDGLSKVNVCEARDGDRILPGHAYLAPGSHHMRIRKSGGRYVISLSDAEPVNRHRPSVDVMFDSVAEAAGGDATGILLTGMGKDGAAGLFRMRQAGAWTIGQDEATCVVFGMPREAARLGALDEVLPLQRIAEQLRYRLSTNEKVVRSRPTLVETNFHEVRG